ncbi:MAG: glutamyl-tRNA reductase [Candidatus Sericytochromatia bacterium]|nr:glutamyl-tRNA reductase [Candidatus Sericytochromatia bacterium]
MHMMLWGISYRTASISQRQRLAWTESEQAFVLRALKQSEGIDEALILSTCNRTEFYLIGANPEQVRQTLHQLLQGYLGGGLDAAVFYHQQGLAVAQHLYHVACGLDSLLKGESHILHQIKASFGLALQQKSSGKILNQLFRQAIQAAKSVRAFWQSQGKVPSLEQQVKLAIQTHCNLTQSLNILLIGAGKINTRIARCLTRNANCRLTFVNRTDAKAALLAEQLQQHWLPWKKRWTGLTQADVVIACTDAGHILVRPADVISPVSAKPRLFLDLAVPRNLDPALAQAPHTLYFDVDAINALQQSSPLTRSLLQKSEALLNTALADFSQWYQSLDYHQTMQKLAAELKHVHQDVLQQMQASPEQLQEMTHILTRRTMRIMSQHLKTCHQ